MVLLFYGTLEKKIQADWKCSFIHVTGLLIFTKKLILSNFLIMCLSKKTLVFSKNVFIRFVIRLPVKNVLDPNGPYISTNQIKMGNFLSIDNFEILSVVVCGM